MLSETRERFVKAILQRVPVARIAEVHFFPPIRQGGVESGVAVIAATQDRQEVVGEEVVTAESAKPELVEPLAVDERAVLETDAPADAELPDEGPAAEEGPADEAPPLRYTVYTARYRLVLKGPDRGKWDATAVAEADAPLVTVDAVVRGVQRRSGETDEPERMSGDELRAALAAAAPR